MTPQDAPQSSQEPCWCVKTGFRYVGTCSDYAALHGALRARHVALGISIETLNAISGLSYCDKLLAPLAAWGDAAANGRRTARGIGPVSLGPLLQSLGLVLIVAEDPAATERLKRRKLWENRGENYVSAAASSIDEILQQRQQAESKRRCAAARAVYTVQVSPERRQKIARKAARIRWEIERRARRIARKIARATP